MNYTSTPSLFDANNTSMKFNGTNAYLEMDNIDKIIGSNDDFTFSIWLLEHNFAIISGRAKSNIYINSTAIYDDDISGSTPDPYIFPGFCIYSDARTWKNEGYGAELYDENNIDYSEFFMSAEDFKKIPLPMHIAITRHKSRIRMFLNGNIKHELDYNHTLFAGGKLITGWHGTTSSFKYSEFTVDDICLIKGIALWTKDFTPPTTYLPDRI